MLGFTKYVNRHSAFCIRLYTFTYIDLRKSTTETKEDWYAHWYIHAYTLTKHQARQHLHVYCWMNLYFVSTSKRPQGRKRMYNKRNFQFPEVVWPINIVDYLSLMIFDHLVGGSWIIAMVLASGLSWRFSEIQKFRKGTRNKEQGTSTRYSDNKYSKYSDGKFLVHQGVRSPYVSY